jgi:hypothetical protein
MRLRRIPAATGLVVTFLLLVSCGSSHHTSSPTTSTTQAQPAATATTTVPSTTTEVPATSTTVDPGSLPQTKQKPVASGAQFDAGVQGLWSAIETGDASLAYPFFFPLSAYEQVKAIRDPAGDWHARLIGGLDADVARLHARLGAGASSATFVSFTVPEMAATWVLPGHESNKLSYWRVYGTVLRYREAGIVHAIPVYSLISWRGEWYLVHLGPPT